VSKLLPWLLGAAAFGGGIVLLARQSFAMTPTSREPTEAEDIADRRQKMGLPPEGSAAAAAPATQRIVLCFGDSLSTGNPPYYKRIKLPGNGLVDGKGFGGQPINAVMNGPKGKPGAIAIMKKTHPTDVVLLAGVNDVANHMVAKRSVADAIARIEKDLTNAWAKIREAGARVWAVKLTPWFGYATYFNPKASRPNDFREVTLKVNSWMDAMRGQPGGPDYVIDTSALGDEQYRLKKEYSSGGLHMSVAGQTALAALVAQAL